MNLNGGESDPNYNRTSWENSLPVHSSLGLSWAWAQAVNLKRVGHGPKSPTILKN